MDPIVGLLAGLAADGTALEFAVGTGRVALPLSARRGRRARPGAVGAHAARLRPKPGAVPVTIGDMTTARVPRSSPSRWSTWWRTRSLNVTTQDASWRSSPTRPAIWTRAAASWWR